MPWHNVKCLKDVQSLSLFIIVYYCCICNGQINAAMSTECRFGTSFPNEVMEGFICVLCSTMNTFHKKRVLSQSLKHRFDRLHHIRWKSILVRVSTIPLFGRTPSPTVAMVSIPVFPYCPHCFSHYRHITYIVPDSSSKMSLYYENCWLFFSPFLPPMPFTCFPLWLNIVVFSADTLFISCLPIRFCT